jgi:hypothetical protein
MWQVVPFLSAVFRLRRLFFRRSQVSVIVRPREGGRIREEIGNPIGRAPRKRRAIPASRQNGQLVEVASGSGRGLMFCRACKIAVGNVSAV